MSPRVAPIAKFVALALASACAGQRRREDPIVRELRLHGVHQIDESDLRARIATRETQYFPAQHFPLRWWRWWWTYPEYFDPSALTRDRLRIRTYYNSQGYFDAEVIAAEVRRVSPTVFDLDVTVREGPPTRITDLRLRGCVRDGGVLPDALCDRLWASLESRPQTIPSQDRIARDRRALTDLLRDEGYPAPRVIPRAVIDPEQHTAWMDYTLVPGPLGRFGDIRLHLLPERSEVTSDTLPNGLPVRVIRAALGIERGEVYSRSSLVNGQQSLFDLGVFGVARVEERARADGTVDLDVQLSPARLWRLRLGGGFEIDPSRNSLHLAAGYEYRNFLGGMRRLRLEARPQVYFPSLLVAPEEQLGEVITGGSATLEVRQPELFRRTAGIYAALFEYGPDPINPSIKRRETLRTNLGVEHRFTPRLSGSLFTRFVQVEYFPINGSSSAALSDNTLAGQQYLDQVYFYLEASLVYDGRNDRIRPTRGSFVRASLSESTRPLSDYLFARGSLDLRQYVPLARGFTLALRGALGLVVGDNDTAARWPVPQELRFYSGGAQSNRGYPQNRVGALGVRDPEGNQRVVAVGGTALWELSAEIRWQPGAFGMVAFFDASQVSGIDPRPYVSPVGVNAGCQTTPVNQVRDSSCTAPPFVAPSPMSAPSAIASLFDRIPNPTVGFGLRYQTPLGPLRFDLGFRLAPGGCDAPRAQIAAQDSAVASGRAASYVITQPQCATVYVTDSSIATFHLTLGEAF